MSFVAEQDDEAEGAAQYVYDSDSEDDDGSEYAGRGGAARPTRASARQSAHHLRSRARWAWARPSPVFMPCMHVQNSVKAHVPPMSAMAGLCLLVCAIA